MKTRTIEVYNCDHCNKLYQRKHAIIKHEPICSLNPENRRPCFGCVSLIKKEVVIESETEYNVYRDTKNVLFCKKKEVHLYPPKIERLKNWYEIEDNYPMPKECDLVNNDILPFN